MIFETLHSALRVFLVSPNAVSRAVGRMGWRLHCLSNNYNFDMNTNGEKTLMEALAPHNMEMVFDVGAYKGHWSALAHATLKPLAIHAFEPVPASYALLERNLSKIRGVEIHQIACGENRKTVPMAFNSDQPTRSGFHARTAKYDHLETIDVEITDGASFCKSLGVKQIDFLKIDSEGHEAQVIAGFEPLLASGSIRAIQFEYSPLGTLYDTSLWALYETLEKHGFIIGKIFPDGVAFAPFKSLKEKMLGPNYCAVLAREHAIIGSAHARRRTNFEYVSASGGPHL